jgi:integrase
MVGRGLSSRGDSFDPSGRLSARRLIEDGLTETRSNGRGIVWALAGLERKVPLQSTDGLRLRIRWEKRFSIAVALKRDVEAHQTRREAGWNPEARSLARFPPLVCNSLLKGNGEDVKTVQESLRHADSKMTLDTDTQGLMPVKRAAQRKVIEMIVPICSKKSQMTTASAWL